MLISVSSSMAQAFENDKDNPIGMTYADDYTNINYRNYDLSNYALNWSGTGNKETVKRDKYQTDSIYIYVKKACYNGSNCNYYAVSAEQNGIGRDTSSYGTKYQKIAVGKEVLVTSWVKEYADAHPRSCIEKKNMNGYSYYYTKCNLSFRLLKSGGLKNSIEGLWSPDSSGDIRNTPVGTIGSDKYPN